MQNYELANIYALRYQLDELPSETRFMSDLEELLVLLWVLESEDLASKTRFVDAVSSVVPSSSERKLSPRQGRQANEKVRKLVELAAEDQAVDHYSSHGWKIERVGAQKLGYDLRCTKGESELHVEVKGTIGKGREVTLTPNEVVHCRQYPSMALVVVSEIDIAVDETIRDRGKLLVIDPWTLEDSRLTPSEYTYRIQRPG